MIGMQAYYTDLKLISQWCILTEMYHPQLTYNQKVQDKEIQKEINTWTIYRPYTWLYLDKGRC